MCLASVHGRKNAARSDERVGKIDFKQSLDRDKSRENSDMTKLIPKVALFACVGLVIALLAFEGKANDPPSPGEVGVASALI